MVFKIKCALMLLILQPLIIAAQPAIPVTDINKACYKAIKLPESPDFLAVSSDHAWVIDDGNSRVQKISVNSNQPLITDTIPGACAAPVIAFNAVWVMSCTEKKLYKIDDRTGIILDRISTGVSDAHGEMSLAVGGGSVWVLSDSLGILTRVNPSLNTIQAKISVMPHSYCAAFGYNAIWVTNTGSNSVQRIDIKTNTVVATIPVGKSPRFLSVGEQGVWTLNQGDGTVSRIDPVLNKTIATIDVNAPGPGGDIVAGGGKVWVVSTNAQKWLQTINPANNTITNIYLQVADNGKVKVDGAIRLSVNYVWVSNLYSKTVWVLKK